MAYQPQTDAINTQALSALVLRHLKRFGAENEIITELCQRTNYEWNWDQAQAFYQQVAAQYQPELTLHKARPLLVVSGVTLLGGLLILGITILWVVGGIVTLDTVLSGQVPGPLSTPYTLLVSPRFMGPLLESGLGYQIILVVVSGIGMLGGGTIGIIQTMRQVREARKQLQSQTIMD